MIFTILWNVHRTMPPGHCWCSTNMFASISGGILEKELIARVKHKQKNTKERNRGMTYLWRVRGVDVFPVGLTRVLGATILAPSALDRGAFGASSINPPHWKFLGTLLAQYASVPFHLDSEGEVSKAYFSDETELGSLKVMLYLRLHYIIRWHDTLRRYRSSRHYESQINCYYTGYTSPLRVFDSK